MATMNIDNIDFSDWDKLDQIRNERFLVELKLWRKIKEGEQGATQQLINHQKEDNILKRKALKSGFIWN